MHSRKTPKEVKPEDNRKEVPIILPLSTFLTAPLFLMVYFLSLSLSLCLSPSISLSLSLSHTATYIDCMWKGEELLRDYTSSFHFFHSSFSLKVAYVYICSKFKAQEL